MYYILLLVLSASINVKCYNNSNSKILARTKRYLVFPEGSSVSIAICMTAQMGITPGEIFTEGINWGISYELPDKASQFDLLKRKPSATMGKKRNRRDLYGKIETIMNSMGYDGRSCILRALCEASSKFSPAGNVSLVDKILKIIFGYPEEKVLPSEPEEHHLYHWASQSGKSSQDQECSEKFTGCPFSLIDLALGYYSNSVS